MRSYAYIVLCVLSCGAMSACGTTGQGVNRIYQPQEGQGQYIRPAHLNPELPQRLPPDDLCQSRIYQNLVGQFEGSLFFQAIPGRQRLVKEATFSDFTPNEDFLEDLEEQPPFVEVREFIAGQPIFTSSLLRTPGQLIIEPVIEDRLTILIDKLQVLMSF